VEKVVMSNTGIVQKAIRLRCFRKHKLKDPKGKEEEGKDLYVIVTFIVVFLLVLKGHQIH
jgi:hypothetical protein